MSLLERMIPALEAGEVDDEILDALTQKIGSAGTRKLEEAIADFEFATALRMAGDLLQELSNP